MSVYEFYVDVNVGCICILLLLLYSIKRLPTPQLKDTLFQKLVLWHVFYFISDSIWALVNDGFFVKNTFSVLAVNYLNAVIAAVLFYSCFIYAEMSTRPEMTRVQIKKLQTTISIPVIVEAVALLVGFIKYPTFWLDENLEPCDLYYFILVFIPLVYIMTVTIRGLIRGYALHDRQKFTTYLIIASYTPGCLVAGGAQVLFSLTTPIFCFWCTLVILFVYLHSQNLLISTDPLTMLNNRNCLYRFINTQREARPSYVFMVDVNHFKHINDTYGHAEGDRALILVSQALRKACERLKYSMFLCRYGGDEFLLIARTYTPDEINKQIKLCLKDVAQENSSRDYTIEASIGYAFWNGLPDSFKESMINADKKMYEDKRLA